MKLRFLALLVAVMLVLMPNTASVARAESSYDSLIKTTPSLYVYTDGSAKTKKLDISSTWWEEFKQAYAGRISQNIGWPTNVVPEFEEIMRTGLWGIYQYESPYGTGLSFFGTNDPQGKCYYHDESTSFRCASRKGYSYVSVDYLTHNSYGGNGCGGYYSVCSSNGLALYAMPSIGIALEDGYSIAAISVGNLPTVKFYKMNFKMQYPDGYAGVRFPITPPPATYVAMGDSFSSGEGNPPFEAGTDVASNKCHRSASAYPRLLAADASLNLGPTAFVACSGATTSNVLGGQNGEPPQVNALSPDTKVVTLTIGGNDVGFGEYAKACVLGLCDYESDQYKSMKSKIANELPSKLNAVLNGINSRTSSSVKVYVVGYPYLTPSPMPSGMGSACWPFNGGLNNSDPSNNSGAAAHDVVRLLNQSIEQSLLNYGSSKFKYVDPNGASSPFNGHDWCSQDRYYQIVALNQQESSFHPNAAGQVAYSRVVRGVM